MAAVAPAADPAAASETGPIQGHFISGKISIDPVLRFIR
jgi:hypothetical protein